MTNVSDALKAAASAEALTSTGRHRSETPAFKKKVDKLKREAKAFARGEKIAAMTNVDDFKKAAIDAHEMTSTGRYKTEPQPFRKRIDKLRDEAENFAKGEKIGEPANIGKEVYTSATEAVQKLRDGIEAFQNHKNMENFLIIIQRVLRWYQKEYPSKEAKPSTSTAPN